MADYKFIKVAEDDGIFTVTFNRPDKRNALSEALWGELKKTFESFEPDVRCVVLAGAGKHFCAGLDLSEHRHREAFESIFMSRFAHATLDAIQFGGRPVVTAMQGAVIGGELELVVLLDVRELVISQAWPDIALAGPGQPLGGFLAQAISVTAVHGRTVAAGAQLEAAVQARRPYGQDVLKARSIGQWSERQSLRRSTTAPLTP